jgi:hypothetical protein
VCDTYVAHATLRRDGLASSLIGSVRWECPDHAFRSERQLAPRPVDYFNIIMTEYISRSTRTVHGPLACKFLRRKYYCLP